LNGADLIERVRRVLKDSESDTIKGEFWSDDEITLCLNEAQNAFINFCLKNNLLYFLTGLSTLSIQNTNTTLPTNYLHIWSSKVSTGDGVFKIAKIYNGGDSYNFIWVKHVAASVIKDKIYFTFMANTTTTQGKMYYFRYPTPILKNAIFVSDFADYIYYDIICEHAAVMASIKGIQTQRDFKKNKRYLQEIVLYPTNIANYIQNMDVATATQKKEMALAGQNQQ
jgi:hypothetical protein